MTSMAAAREVVSRQFENVVEIDDQVIRGEKLHKDKAYAIAYFDLADDIVERANHLREFQERVLGEDFFQAPEQLRWNNYLYIVAGPKSVNSGGYLKAKSTIEADKDYARKRVVSEVELVELLGDSKLFEAEEVTASADIMAIWAEKLTEGNLDLLMDLPTPRTAVLQNIGKGTAARSAKPKKPKPLSSVDEIFSTSHLKKLEVAQFRPVHNGHTYSFGAVTLIVGANGTGKTSLLEAIELLYCGHNRRPASHSSPSVTGSFANLESGEVIMLKSTSDSNRIKGRCLAWYGRAEHQAKSIVDAFTRFNFLDTDAAFRLSSELEPGDISNDLSRLLIGADAATLWDYLGKTHLALETEWEKSTSQIERQLQANGFLERELEQLRNLPSEAKSLSTTYRAVLKTAGWRGTSQVGEQLVVSGEREPLEALVAEIASLISLSLPHCETIAQIRGRAGSLAQTVKTLEPIEKQRRDANVALSTLEQQSNGVRKEIDVLGKWLEFCGAKFPQSLHIKEKTKRDLETSRQRLGALISVAPPAIDDNLKDVSLVDVEVGTDQAIEAMSASIRKLESSEQQFGQWETAYAKASQQLKDAAKVLTEHAEATGNCPVCGTIHSPESLAEKIEKITERQASSAPLKELQEQLNAERSQLSSARQLAAVIKTLRQIFIQLKLSQDTTIGKIINSFQALKDKVTELELAAAAADETIRNLASKGLVEADFNSLKSDVKALFDEGQDIEAVASIESCRQKKIEAETVLELRRQQLQAESASALQTVRSAIEALGQLSPSEDLSNGSGTYEFLLKTLERHETALSKAVAIGLTISLDDDLRFVDLQVTLSALISALDQALHAAVTESNTSNALTVKTAELGEAKNLLEQIRIVNKNQGAALEILRSLRAESSLEGATCDALDSIREQINDVFSRVHSPSEYEYDGYGDNILRTREGHVSRSLEEVSTGQRAAFALSIFLALNLTAQSAPPIVLIDDPIAHIDDLNALSFMDYLRDLSVHSRRQIFFATADSRVAALFEKKFAFLGQEKFQRIDLARRLSEP
ncbi:MULTISPECIES: hypothetical protein [unclassified Janthinobacterium]|uniref:AAA family ATPase n=1 Tax=unclassified Janthinobacterium TaxID=2610881 RepID=UPI00161DF78C|nr:MULTISPECIES: hypothetical protein [unclassified Janthinobacterium]MBB5371401.1 chromosome segregation protein [Janthinobacterium sp. K2C7]MBB5384207.1 chromosome segregation protein [Janthinobacterium sp. K2Li3]MBB5389333.1 chromosome segregation protein [Janthinobacterium sp. K2E3]